MFLFCCLTFSLTGQNKREKIVELNKKSEEVFNSDLNLSLSYAKMAKKIAMGLGDELGMAISELNIVNVLVERLKLNQALAKTDTLLITLKRLKNDSLLGKAYLLKGEALTFDSRYDQAIDCLLTSINYYKSDNHARGLASAYNSLGIAFDEYKNPEKAILYYKKSLVVSTKYNFLKIKSSTLLNIGVIYLNKGNFDNARGKFKEAIEIFEQINLFKGIIYAKTNVAITYRKEKRYDNAIELYSDILKMNIQCQDTASILRVLNNMANVYLEIPNYQKALKLYIQSLDLSISKNNRKQIAISYRNIGLTYASLGNYKKAYENYTQAYALKMEIFNSENSQKAIELEEKYQSKVKESEILKLNNENQKKETAIARSELLLFVSIAISFLLVVIGITVMYQRKNKYKLAIQAEQIESIKRTLKQSEEEKVRLGKSLHDEVVGELIRLYYDTEIEHPDISQKVLKSYNNVRAISHRLDNRPQHDELLIDRLAELIPQYSHQKFQLSVLPNNLILSEPIGTHLYRITQELVNNSLKHAMATYVNVGISQSENAVTLIFEDNGLGVKDLKYGNGLLNVSDRIKILMGELSINTSPGKGFNVFIKIPYNI